MPRGCVERHRETLPLKWCPLVNCWVFSSDFSPQRSRGNKVFPQPQTALREAGNECNPNTSTAALREETALHSLMGPENVTGQNDAAQE